MGILGLLRLWIILRGGVVLFIIVMVLRLCVFVVIVRVMVRLRVVIRSEGRSMAVVVQSCLSLLCMVVFRGVRT